MAQGSISKSFSVINCKVIITLLLVDSSFFLHLEIECV